jgi:hypothetical protein
MDRISCTSQKPLLMQVKKTRVLLQVMMTSIVRNAYSGKICIRSVGIWGLIFGQIISTGTENWRAYDKKMERAIISLTDSASIYKN